jgi:hypothetical protein
VLLLKNSFKADAHVLNLSVAVIQSSPKTEQCLEEIVDNAVRSRVLVVAAAGEHPQTVRPHLPTR